MVDEAHHTSDPVNAHREPPPSLGMVAHIWAGHLGPLDSSEPEEPAEFALDAGAIELLSPRAARVKVD
jgi:hypothetical protein